MVCVNYVAEMGQHRKPLAPGAVWSSCKAPYQRGKGVPGPKGDHEAEPGKEEDAPVDIDGVQDGHGPGLQGDRVDVRTGVEVREPEAHVCRLGA
jgi:hypothetical protein